MRIVNPELTWTPDYSRPERVHLQETCDGQPRLLDRGEQDGMVPVAVCRAWLANASVKTNTAVGERCPACADVAARIGIV